MVKGKEVKEIQTAAPPAKAPQTIEFKATLPSIRDILEWKNVRGASEHFNYLAAMGINDVTVRIESRPGQSVVITVESRPKN